MHSFIKMTTLYKDIIETFCSNNKQHEIKL